MSLPTGHEHRCTDETQNRSELEENLEILRNVPSFSAIPLERLKVYAYLSKRMCYQEGKFLFRKGEHDDRGYIIVTGKVHILRECEKHLVSLEELKEGDFFGGLALLADIERLFSAKAMSDVECLTLDRLSFQKLLLQFPETVIRVLDVMIKRIARMEEKFLNGMDFQPPGS
jgi:CRP-like cAMP-binding protein